MTFFAPLDNASSPIDPDPQNRSKNTVSSILIFRILLCFIRLNKSSLILDKVGRKLLSLFILIDLPLSLPLIIFINYFHFFIFRMRNCF